MGPFLGKVLVQGAIAPRVSPPLSLDASCHVTVCCTCLYGYIDYLILEISF